MLMHGVSAAVSVLKDRVTILLVGAMEAGSMGWQRKSPLRKPHLLTCPAIAARGLHNPEAYAPHKADQTPGLIPTRWGSATLRETSSLVSSRPVQSTLQLPDDYHAPSQA